MLRSDPRGGSGRMGCGFWHIWVWGDVDQTCVWIGGGVWWGEVRCVYQRCVDRREVRWGASDWRSKTVNRGRKTHRGSTFGSVIGLPWRIGGEVSSTWPGVGWIGVSGWIGGRFGGWALSLSRSLSFFCVWPGNGLKVK